MIQKLPRPLLGNTDAFPSSPPTTRGTEGWNRPQPGRGGCSISPRQYLTSPGSDVQWQLSSFCHALQEMSVVPFTGGDIAYLGRFPFS